MTLLIKMIINYYTLDRNPKRNITSNLANKKNKRTRELLF